MPEMLQKRMEKPVNVSRISNQEKYDTTFSNCLCLTFAYAYASNAFGFVANWIDKQRIISFGVKRETRRIKCSA